MTKNNSIYIPERGAKPDTPDTGEWALYMKSDGAYVVDDAGTETALGGGSGMTSFDIGADTGTPEEVTDGDQVTIAGGDGIDTSVAATDTVTVAVDNTVARLDATQTLTNKTLTTPTIGDFTNAVHDHEDNAGGGQLNASNVFSGGTVAHERGGLEADVSAYDGLIRIASGTTTNIKANYAANSAPTVNDDTGDGYVVGSFWYDTTADKAYTCLDASSGAAVWTEITAGGGAADLPYAILEDQKAQNTSGGTSTGATWSTRDLNTEVVDADSIVTISSNEFTPIEGTYLLDCVSPFLADATGAVAVRIRLYNVTAAAVVDTSSVFYVQVVASSVGGVEAVLNTGFVANGSDEYRIEYYITDGRGTNGLGFAMNVSGEVEHYTKVRLTKIA